MRPRALSLIAWTIPAGAWVIAFCLACRLTTSFPVPAHETGITDFLLGGSRQALSHAFFNEADLYFHKGVAHLEARADTHSLFQHWQADITPEQHAHAEGGESAEILPWLELAMRSDPHNVEAFLVAAFWTSTGLQRNDLAMQILEDAQRLNPGDYRIPLEKGRMAIRIGNFAAATAVLESALVLQTHARDTGTEPDLQFALDRAEILIFLGFLREIKGATADALDCFKNALAIFPDRVYIRERVALLEAGKTPQDSAQNLLQKLTHRTVHDVCHKAEGEDHDHAHDDGDHDD